MFDHAHLALALSCIPILAISDSLGVVPVGRGCSRKSVRFVGLSVRSCLVWSALINDSAMASCYASDARWRWAPCSTKVMHQRLYAWHPAQHRYRCTACCTNNRRCVAASLCQKTVAYQRLMMMGSASSTHCLKWRASRSSPAQQKSNSACSSMRLFCMGVPLMITRTLAGTLRSEAACMHMHLKAWAHGC